MTDYVAALRTPGTWQYRDAERFVNQVKAGATVTDGVLRWNSNNSVPPSDIVALAATLNLSVDVDACDRARSSELKAFLEEYRAVRARRTPEVIAEEVAQHRAECGPGVTLVDVITGEVTKT